MKRFAVLALPWVTAPTLTFEKLIAGGIHQSCSSSTQRSRKATGKL